MISRDPMYAAGKTLFCQQINISLECTLHIYINKEFNIAKVVYNITREFNALEYVNIMEN